MFRAIGRYLAKLLVIIGVSLATLVSSLFISMGLIIDSRAVDETMKLVMKAEEAITGKTK